MVNRDFVNLSSAERPFDENDVVRDSGTAGNTRDSSENTLKQQESFSESDISFRGTKFNDGARQIDFILVYTEKLEGNHNPDETPRIKGLKLPEKTRRRFLMSLLKGGVEMERAVQYGGEKVINFIKLHIPFQTLCAYAEDLNFSLPLLSGNQEENSAKHREVSNPFESFTDALYGACNCRNPHSVGVSNRPRKLFVAPFKVHKLSNYKGHQDPYTFFSDTQRAAAVWRVLQTTSYGRRRDGNVGIEPLLDGATFLAAYPLHDSPPTLPEGVDDEDLGKRQILLKYWADWGLLFKFQPTDHIREYFGERIGVYFAWLGYYTGLLIPAALVGLFVFVYGLITMNADPVVVQICESGNTYKMCKTCMDEVDCDYWYISQNCIYGKLGYLSDHPGTLFFACFMSLWAVVYMEFWKRRTSQLAFDWDCWEYHEVEESIRSQYMNFAPNRAINRITGIEEPHFPKHSRLKRIVASFVFILVMMVLVVIFLVACILYRVLVSIPLSGVERLQTVSSIVIASTGAGINLALLLVLEQIYNIMARKLTNWELHRTQTEFEDSLATKVYMFQFVNYYSTIFYIAFFKGKFIGYPGNYKEIFGLRNEMCANNNCMLELTQQMLILMIGKQFANNLYEIVVPSLQSWLKNRKLTKSASTEVQQRWEEDFKLVPSDDLWEEYLELVLQFGFATLFAAACPLAPLLALINNFFEARLDASKFIKAFRRPVAERCSNIGVWGDIIRYTAHLAVITNACLIAFTSSLLPRQLYKYEMEPQLNNFLNFTLAVSLQNNETCRYQEFRDTNGDYTSFWWNLMVVRLIFVLVFEHFVFGIMLAADFFIPDVSNELNVTIKREQYLAKQALANTEISNLLAKTKEEDDYAENKDS